MHVTRSVLPWRSGWIRTWIVSRMCFGSASSDCRVAGGAKRALLARVLRRGDLVLELGAYVGYGALATCLALRSLGGGRVITVPGGRRAAASRT